MTKSDIEHVADRILRSRLASFGYRSAIVRFERDCEGDEAIEIEARLESLPDRMANRPLLDIAGAMRKALLDGGEERFPYVSSSYEAEPPAAGTNG